jgi:flagellar protein FliL
MSAAAASKATAESPGGATDVADAKPVKRGKKKLIVIAAALAVLLGGGGAAAYVVMKKRAAAAAAAEESDTEGADVKKDKLVKADIKHAPTFVPLDPFTVNLADREAERYAQVGITLELSDAKAGDLLKAYMPAIRHNILLALGAKTAAQLTERDGKLLLASEIRREALRPLGYEIEAPQAGAKPAPANDDTDADAAPIRAVHFSNFIIQ